MLNNKDFDKLSKLIDMYLEKFGVLPSTIGIPDDEKIKTIEKAIKENKLLVESEGVFK